MSARRRWDEGQRGRNSLKQGPEGTGEGWAAGSDLRSGADLGVGELGPGLLAVGEDLPENHPKAPHVTLRSELPIHDAFRGHPANGEHGMSSHLKGAETEAHTE